MSGTGVGAISLGYRPDGSRIRRKVTGRTKTEVRDKLEKLQAEADAGIEPALSAWEVEPRLEIAVLWCRNAAELEQRCRPRCREAPQLSLVNGTLESGLHPEGQSQR
jgi:hypothetical protein